jgi:hypothetical protein
MILVEPRLSAVVAPGSPNLGKDEFQSLYPPHAWYMDERYFVALASNAVRHESIVAQAALP